MIVISDELIDKQNLIFQDHFQFNINILQSYSMQNVQLKGQWKQLYAKESHEDLYLNLQNNQIRKLKIYSRQQLRLLQKYSRFHIQKHKCYPITNSYPNPPSSQSHNQPITKAIKKKNFIMLNKKNILATFLRLEPTIKFILTKYRKQQLQILEKIIKLKQEPVQKKPFLIKKKSESLIKFTQCIAQSTINVDLRKSQGQNPIQNEYHKDDGKMEKIQYLCRKVRPFAGIVQRKIKLMKQNHFIEQIIQKLPKNENLEEFIKNAITIADDRIQLLKAFSYLFQNEQYVNTTKNIPSSIHRYESLKKQLQPILQKKKQPKKFIRSKDEIIQERDEEYQSKDLKRRVGKIFKHQQHQQILKQVKRYKKKTIQQKQHTKNKATIDTQNNFQQNLHSNQSINNTSTDKEVTIYSASSEKEASKREIFSYQDIQQRIQVQDDKQSQNIENFVHKDKKIKQNQHKLLKQNLIEQPKLQEEIEEEENNGIVTEFVKRNKRKKRNQIKIKSNQKKDEPQTDFKEAISRKKKSNYNQVQRFQIKIKKVEKKIINNPVPTMQQSKKLLGHKTLIKKQLQNLDPFKYIKINEKKSFIYNKMILLEECQKIKKYMVQQDIPSDQFQEFVSKQHKSRLPQCLYSCASTKQMKNYKNDLRMSTEIEQKNKSDLKSQQKSSNCNTQQYFQFFINLKKQYARLQKQQNPRIIEDFFFNIFKFCLVEFEKIQAINNQQRFIPSIVLDNKKNNPLEIQVCTKQIKQNFQQELKEFTTNLMLMKDKTDVIQTSPQNIGKMEIFRYSVFR